MEMNSQPTALVGLREATNAPTAENVMKPMHSRATAQRWTRRDTGLNVGVAFSPATRAKPNNAAVRANKLQASRVEVPAFIVTH